MRRNAPRRVLIALETHLAAPRTAAFLAQIGPAVDGILEVTRFEVSDFGPLFGR